MPISAGRTTIPDAPLLAASKRFGKYKGIEESDKAKPKFHGDPALDRLLGIWGEYIQLAEKWRIKKKNNYRLACPCFNEQCLISQKPGVNRKENCTFEFHTNHCHPSHSFVMNPICNFFLAACWLIEESGDDTFFPKEIEKFSVALGSRFDCPSSIAESEPFYAGLFLSALIDSSGHDGHILHTGHLPLVSYLGFLNSKSVVIEGDCGNIGLCMRGGSIIVNGNAGGQVGYGMTGGAITIEGDAESAGMYMKGGEIHINGEYHGRFVPEGMKGGKIYYQGILIADK